jgi:hypothetical protein
MRLLFQHMWYLCNRSSGGVVNACLPEEEKEGANPDHCVFVRGVVAAHKILIRCADR